jgi:hypothetical protein
MALEIEQLERWVLFGASWNVVQISDALVVVDLVTCMGEQVERRRSDDPSVIDYVRRSPPRCDNA